MAILETCSLQWRSESDCEVFAQRLAHALAGSPAPASISIELHGSLGAGKTTLVRHLLRALGVTGRIKSPSYAVMESYELPLGETSHFDFYRFNDPREWEDAGFRDVFARPGLKLSEWPEKAAGMLPPADLQITLDLENDEVRRVRLDAGTRLGASIVSTLRVSG